MIDPDDDFDEWIKQERLEITKVQLTSAKVQIIGTEVDPDLVHGICPYCEKQCEDIARRRLNTRYGDEESNWITSCYSCWEERIDHYNELWDEYRSGQGV